MNRLILIGNGFDLAHGLKTSYKDFIFWYLDQCFESAGIYANGHYFEDDFLRIKIFDYQNLTNLRESSRDIGISKFLYKKEILGSYLHFVPGKNYVSPKNIQIYQSISEILAHEVVFKSLFFKRLVDTCLECGWVDIEQEYFDALKKYNDSNNSHDLDYIRTINRDFAYFKTKLEEYLTEQVEELEPSANEILSRLLNDDFDVEDFDTVIDREHFIGNRLDQIVQVKNTDQLYVLNFNYTNTFAPYIHYLYGDSGRYHDFEENHIHGVLNDPTNPVIFGFGDEHDKEYLEFEERRRNDLFEHIKSYHYLKTPNYRNLIRFLNKDQYQVFIVGHSCGLSDRTMFKEIFDHENCKSVRIFHYTDKDGKNDFFDKSVNLGRHFSDKGRMRKLVVEFKPEDAIPQIKKNNRVI